MKPAKDVIRRHTAAALSACLAVIAAYSVVIICPTKNGISVLLGMLLLPGTTLGFFVGGGMSMVDGLTPAWRDDSAFALAFLVNAALMYGVCLLLAKSAKIAREALRAT
jgi:uncharacterized membrane protein YfcA